MSLLDQIRKKKWPATAAVIVAAGSGSRMGDIDKLLVELRGTPVLARTISAFENALCIDEIILVVRREQVETFRIMAQDRGFQKIKDIVAGGATRMESVQRGLKAVSRKMELVAIQDGARPLVTPELIQRTVEGAMRYRAAAPAIPVKDTIKQVDETGKVLSTPERAELRAVQTPQVFQKHLYLAARKTAKKAEIDFTDDCMIMERFGVPVYLIEGSEENLKITTPLDLVLAESILSGRKS